MGASQHSIEVTQVTEWKEGRVRSFIDDLAAEEPLEIRIDGVPLTVTMRTPGNDRELAVGFLWTEGVITSLDEVERVEEGNSGAGQTRNVVAIELRNVARAGGSKRRDLQRNFLAVSGCGICGKTSIESVRRRGLRSPNPDFRIDPDVLCSLPVRLRQEQQVFGRTGGLHAAALFDSAGELLALREDIGRHNAVDKIMGWALLRGMAPLADCVLMVSGRGGFEIVQKAIAGGVPVLASVSAPSSLAVRLAREMDLTLVGFVREGRFVVYSGQRRCSATWG